MNVDGYPPAAREFLTSPEYLAWRDETLKNLPDEPPARLVELLRSFTRNQNGGRTAA
ncbi:hypothetical protein [Hoyosella altamirensis]|uniref:hypothetical protein n=1 Tax=Hoyosella altamirensis TaxID=616997 RepID=UPI0012ED149A|nr:hypothetical protein [Hoyosella altamirensis]